nr:PREDICTED: zinc finger protein 839 [Anolis carolinensis]|eukprot:XP_003224118.2 PREDICTED: zinc finger protein 839 [Anolis carolinensis]
MAAPERTSVVSQEKSASSRVLLDPQTSASPASLPPASSIFYSAFQELQKTAQLQEKSGKAAEAFTRLLPPKPEKKKEEDKSTPGPAVAHPKSLTTVQPVEKNSKILGLGVNPQIIQIHPTMGIESQQIFLHNSSKPTVQLLLHSPLHLLGQISVGKITTHGQKNKPAEKAPTDSSNSGLISANSLIKYKKQKEQKIKKSLKVKTRSGRVSCPPKYKAKDYKFIKTEDLADCHQSDSDDYSELSLEDDEGGKGTETCTLFDSLKNDLRPKLFKCQSCEKSYIGQGGLARHYKLNPNHGQQEPFQSFLINRPQKKTLLENIGKRSSEAPSVTATLVNKSGIDTELEKDFLKENERQLSQHFPNEDFMEQAVPHFTKLVTVFEFLLMKVEQKYQKKALFPDVYREFEELHAMVKRMCQDYFGNPELRKPVEVNNEKVAESLGITDCFLLLKKTQVDCSPEYIETTSDCVFTKTVEQKCATEPSDEMLPLAKKCRVEYLPENINIDYSNHSRKEGGGSMEGNCAANVQSGNALWEEEHELLEEIVNDQDGLDLYDQSTEVRLESMKPSEKSEMDCSGRLSSWGETLPTNSAVSSDEKLMQTSSSWSKGNEVTLSSGNI